MSSRSTLFRVANRMRGWSIALGIVMIVLVALLLIGWITLPLLPEMSPALYWTFVTLGALFLILVLVGVVIYLSLSIKAINLNQRQSNFIDSVTHELKSPIASLKLYLQTLTRREVSPGQRTDFYNFMLEDIERLDRLINQLLITARVDRVPVRNEMEDVDVSEVVRQCIETVRLQYRLGEDVFQLRMEPAAVRCHPVDLEMIIRNLIDNAAKYADDDPEISVTTQFISASRLLIRIADNGRGIAPQWRRKIFGRFVRLGRELERDKPGTGLGLYIVRTLVNRLSGKISVRTPDNGRGTLFEIQLPAQKREPAKVLQA